jgi:hypothetical protein
MTTNTLDVREIAKRNRFVAADLKARRDMMEALRPYMEGNPTRTVAEAIGLMRDYLNSAPLGSKPVLTDAQAKVFGFKVLRTPKFIQESKDRYICVEYATAEILRASCRLERRGSNRRLWMERVLVDHAEQLKDGATLGDVFPELRVVPAGSNG